MRTILSLDVGITTGFAVLDVDGLELDSTLLVHGTIEASGLEKWLNTLLLMHKPRWSVAEMPIIVRGKLGNQLQKIVITVKRTLDHQVEEITPSEWKPHPLAKTPLPRGLTTHERDAIRLGLVFRSRVVENLNSNV